MDRFIARENIRHFRDRLETETDPDARSLLHSLLIQEVDKLGRDSEALQEVDNLIAHVKGHLNRQQTLLVSIVRDGHDTAHVLALLNSYTQALFTFENQRKKILIKLQESGL